MTPQRALMLGVEIQRLQLAAVLHRDATMEIVVVGLQCRLGAALGTAGPAREQVAAAPRDRAIGVDTEPRVARKNIALQESEVVSGAVGFNSKPGLAERVIVTRAAAGEQLGGVM